MKEKQHMSLALCTGCGIGECINAGQLLSAAGEMVPDIPCITHRALCSEGGLEGIRKVLRDGDVKKLVVAACSSRVKNDLFDLEGIMVERVNLREQVTWVMEAGHEDTQAAADDQVCMALARLGSIGENTPYVPEELHEDVLVVGGGIAGLTAALEGAKAGFRIQLVEKGSGLGGYAGRLYKALPGIDGVLREPGISHLAAEVLGHGSIHVHLGTMVRSISGEPGNFTVLLEGKEEKRVRTGAIVTATGWKPYDPSNLGHIGYGIPGVKTLEEFEQFVQEAQVPRRVLFVLCAGSRDESHLPYCSGYCCSAALKQALYVREKNPESEVYIVYRDIRTTAFQEDFYRLVQEDDSILMTKGMIESVSGIDDHLLVSVKEALLGEEIALETDMVVLATGMQPNSTEDLKLQYRLGEGLPELEYEFSDSHFICFPYETRRTGIYAAGTVRAPMDMDQSQEDGAGAMMKAIQCIRCVARGEAVHPRAGDMTWPELYMERCTDCKRCTEECPFGAYDETEKGTPLPNPARCRRCGICLGSCPERVIGFSDFNINSVSAMIKASSMPDEFEEKPRVLVFVCENDAYPALDAAGFHRIKYSPFVRIIPVRCLGSINKVWISDALSHGYDGILQIGCKPGDDYQCHFIHGSELTEQRGENLKETLQTMMLEPERIKTEFVEITDHHKITEIINDYMEELEMIGPNPFKSM